MRAMLTGYRFQLQVMRMQRDSWLSLVTAPFFAVIFLALIRQAGRQDLTGTAVLAPALITLWSMSLTVSGEIVDSDRWLGTLELAVAAPVRLSALVAGRILAVSSAALLAVPESLLVARLGFGARLELFHPVVLLLAVIATAVAMSGTALVMTALFVVTRTARTFQNSSSYPFYVLSGVMVPLSLLPVWVRPLGRLIFLSWSADLLRACLRPAPIEAVPARLGAILLLGAAGYLLGSRLLARMLDRVRATGSVSLA